MNQTPPIEIDVQSVKKRMEGDENLLLLDVREPSEYDTAKIDGSTFIPMATLPQRVGELEADLDRPIVVHCHHGGRSLQVTQWLRERGFTRVQNMSGGIQAWSEQVDASVPTY